MYQYNDERLAELIKNYRQTGNAEEINRELKFLSRADIPEYGKEVFYFLDDILQLAKKYGHKDVAAKCTEVGNLVKKTSGVAFAHTAVLEDALGGKDDCVKLIEECLENGQYQSALTKIISFIEKEKDFSIAYEVMKTIDRSSIADPVAPKEDVAFYFIDRMKKIISKIPKGLLGGLRFKDVGWEKGSSNAYVKYSDVVVKYERIRKKRGK